MFTTRRLTTNPLLNQCFNNLKFVPQQGKQIPRRLMSTKSSKTKTSNSDPNESQYVINLNIPKFCNTQTIMRPFQAYKENFIFWSNNKFNLLKEKSSESLIYVFADHVPQTYLNWYKYSLIFMTGVGFYAGAKSEYDRRYKNKVNDLIMSGLFFGGCAFATTSVLALWHPVTIPILITYYLFGDMEMNNKKHKW